MSALTPSNARISEALSSDRYHEEASKTRLNRLYGLAYRTWQHGNREDFARLTPLLRDLITRREELTPEEDAAFRRIYKLGPAK